MARVERTSLSQPFAVEQAQLIDPSGFRFGTASAEELEIIGGVLSQLGKRELEAKNSLAINAAVESRQLAKLKMQEFIKNNPDPDTWQDGLLGIIQEHGKIYSQQRFNAKTQKEQKVEEEAFRDQLTMNVRIATVTQNVENDIAISSKNLIDAVSTDDGTSEAAQDIQEQIELCQAALERKYEPKVVAIHMEEILKEAEKQRIDNIKKDIMNRATIRPELMVSFIDTELKARAKGKKALDEFALLSERELKTLRDYAISAGKAAITAKELEQEQIDNEVGEEFLRLLINKLDPTKPQLTFDMIVDSPASFDAKQSWFTKLQVFDNYSESELKEAFTDKGEVLADIYDKIDAETLTDELDTMVGKGLSPNTAERIKKDIRTPYEAKTDKIFKTIFGWSPELGFENDLSSFLYLKTERDWRKEIKRQDATGEKIVEIGRSIARPYFIEHLKKTMMGQEADIARMVELALGEELQKTEPEVKPKEDEGPRTYQEFEDEVARLKNIDMAKARDFYDAWIGKFEETETEEK